MMRSGDAPRVGRPARVLLASVLALAALVAGACAGTTELVLGEAPLPGVDAAVVDVDAALPAPVDAACDACVTAVALSGLSLTAQAGGDGGTAYTDTCPGSQAVIGYQGYITDPSFVNLRLVGGIQALCADVVLTPAGFVTTANAYSPIRGLSVYGPWTQTCPPSQVVVGFTGRSGIALDQVDFACAPLALGDGGVVEVGASAPLPPVGGDGGTAFSVSCPGGQIARGSDLRAGDWVDAFGLVCGTPALVVPTPNDP